MAWRPTINPYGYGWNDESADTYHVVISKPGPRGGKRPPLLDVNVRADSYTEAVQFAEQEFLSTTETEVTCPA